MDKSMDNLWIKKEKKEKLKKKKKNIYIYQKKFDKHRKKIKNKSRTSALENALGNQPWRIIKCVYA